MLGLKPRAGLLGLLAMLLVGLFATASAEAQGPFWYHRALNGQGKGVKLSARAPEEVRGGGGETRLEGKNVILGETVITSSQVQVKGIIYNNDQQGQAKLDFTYFQPKLVKPEGTTCVVTIGTGNVVRAFGHQAWTWDGTKGQLEEQPQLNQNPDGILVARELEQGVKELPKEEFTKLTLSGAGCLLASKSKVEGSIAVTSNPQKVGVFGTEVKGEALGNGRLQHIQNGLGATVGVETDLSFAGSPASLKQANSFKTFGRQGGTPQEVALYES